jgi:hypothetical protein
VPEGLVRSWIAFWFTPVDPVGLHVLRVLAGLLFLAWLLPFAGHLDSLFGLHGWFDQKAYAEIDQMPGLFPPVGWSLLYLRWVGANPGVLTAVYGVSLAVIALFTLGVAPRLTAVLTWVVVISFTANPALYYEGDVLLRVLAFYLMVGYLLLGLRSTDQPRASVLLGPMWFLRGPWRWPSVGANLALRLLQVHVAIVIVASGLHKLQFGDWWGGVALWYALYPPLETTLAQARANAGQYEAYLTLLSLATYAVLVWQLGFPLYAWRPSWRFVLVGGALIGWLGTAFVYRLPLIGPAILIGCLGFLTPEEWRRVFGWMAYVPGLRWLAAANEGGRVGVRRDEALERADVHFGRSEAGSKSESITSRVPGG